MVILVILYEMKEAEIEVLDYFGAYFLVYFNLVPMMIFIYLDPLNIATIKSQQVAKRALPFLSVALSSKECWNHRLITYVSSKI